jgi:hypothetical protein
LVYCRSENPSLPPTAAGQRNTDTFVRADVVLSGAQQGRLTLLLA